MTLALNHLAPFLLTTLLLDTLKRSAPARIVTVSSGAHKDAAAFDFADPEARPGGPRRPAYSRSELRSLLFTLAAPWKHPGFTQYAQTKLANLLFTFELARRLQGTGVTANALHPGFVRTRLMRGNGSFGVFMRFWAAVLGRTPERGARDVVLLAASLEVEGVTGAYYVDGRAVPPSPAALDPGAATRLWSLSEELTAGRAPP